MGSRLSPRSALRWKRRPRVKAPRQFADGSESFLSIWIVWRLSMSDAAKPVILCVDDEPPVLRLIKQYLADGGYEALTADGGDTALLTLHQTKPDLILLDIMMPGMDGY